LNTPRKIEDETEAAKYKYSMQYNVTLFNPATSFFGRTYRGRRLALKNHGDQLEGDQTDWVLFYTQSESIETKAVVEVVVYETDQVTSATRTFGVGYALAPLFYEQMPTEVDLWLGSPRDVLKNLSDIGFEPPKSPSVLAFSVALVKEQPAWLMSLVPDNTLVGSNDEVPGLNGTKMPGKLSDMGEPAAMQTIYAHNVRISSLVEVEQAFAAYIKDWRSFP
jgi:hypothetical protein